MCVTKEKEKEIEHVLEDKSIYANQKNKLNLTDIHF